MNISIVKLNKNTKVPEYGTKDAAGFDLVANNFKRIYTNKEGDDVYCYEEQENIEENNYQSVTVGPFDRLLVGTGLKMEIPKGYELQIRPRSGLALNNGITVANSPGTIDADYRGEIGVILINNSNIDFKVNIGDRIAQGVLNKFEQCLFTEVEELDTTDRGKGGFGSTGISGTSDSI